jgi:indoleamine 2,3-dioxygenase
VSSCASFTNTPDEAHFYLTSARCELAGVHALDLMRCSLDEAFIADSIALTRLTSYLSDLAVQIGVIGDIIVDVKNGCRPDVFYHVIRPWFRGGDADGPESLGWLFEGVSQADEDRVRSSGAEHAQSLETPTSGPRLGRKFSGPSAGQSTLIHALDVFLMVDHKQSSETAEETFMSRMQAYMPHPHRSFLTHLMNAPHPIRSLVLQNKETRPELAKAYDEALGALKTLRDKHMKIVTLYIIQQARRQASDEMIAMGAPAPVGMDDGEREKELVQGSLSDLIEEQEKKSEELRGTGGTALIKFLKMCRDNTLATMVGRNA